MTCRDCKWFDNQAKIGRAGCCDAPVPDAVRYHDKLVMLPSDGTSCPCFKQADQRCADTQLDNYEVGNEYERTNGFLRIQKNDIDRG